VLRGSHDNYASPEMIEYPAAPRPQVSDPSLEYVRRVHLHLCASQPW